MLPEPNLPPAVGHNEAPKQKQKDGRENVQYYVQLFTVLLVAIYTGFAGWQVSKTQDAIRLSREQFTRDQRPYVMVNGVFQEPGSHVAEGQKTCWHIAVSNYGRSPAVQLVMQDRLVLGPALNALTFVDQWFSHLQSPLLGDVGFLPPGGPPPPSSTPPPFLTEWKEPATGQRLTSICTSEPLTKEHATSVHSGKMRILIAGRIEYRDLGANKYHTDFCLGPIASGIIMWCDTLIDTFSFLL